MEAFCLAPIDVIKTRLQLDRTGKYHGIRHCGQTIFQTEGLAALWKGVVPFATHLTFKYALRMGSNSFYQNLMRDENGHLNNYRCSLLASLCCTMPISCFQKSEGSASPSAV